MVRADGLPAAAFGAWLLTLFRPAYVEFLLGCFLLLNLRALLRRNTAGRPYVPLPSSRLPLLGAVGVIFNRAYYRLGLSKEEIGATRAMNEVLLHLLKIALYAAFGLLPRPALLAGALVAAAAIAASWAARPILSVMHESLFRRAGLAAMVVSGIAMFTLSSSQIMAIHRVWIAYVAPGGERELQLYWGGIRKASLEHEGEGGLVVERTVTLSDLPPPVRTALAGRIGADTVVTVERVHEWSGSY